METCIHCGSDNLQADDYFDVWAAYIDGDPTEYYCNDCSATTTITWKWKLTIIKKE